MQLSRPVPTHIFLFSVSCSTLHGLQALAVVVNQSCIRGIASLRNADKTTRRARRMCKPLKFLDASGCLFLAHMLEWLEPPPDLVDLTVGYYSREISGHQLELVSQILKLRRITFAYTKFMGTSSSFSTNGDIHHPCDFLYYVGAPITFNHLSSYFNRVGSDLLTNMGGLAGAFTHGHIHIL